MSRRVSRARTGAKGRGERPVRVDRNARPAGAEGTYRTLYLSFWGDPAVRRLSRPGPNAHDLYLYLLHGPHTSIIPGLCQIGELALAEAMRWDGDVAGFRRAFQELVDANMARADWEARVVYLPGAPRWHRPQNPDTVAGWRNALSSIPDCPLKDEAVHDLTAYLRGFADLRYVNSFLGRSATPAPDPVLKGAADGGPDGDADGAGEQEQEQKQHQEQQPPQGPPGGGEGGFVRFWESWPEGPRKVNRSEAMAAWRAMGLDAKADSIIASLAQWKLSAQWTKEGGRFVTPPARWLREEHFNAEPEVGGGSSASAFSEEALLALEGGGR